MKHYVGDDHLSPDHILDRHEDTSYRPPYYPHSWEERKWGKIFQEYYTGLSEMQVVRKIIQERLAYVIQQVAEIIGKRDEEKRNEQIRNKELQKGYIALQIAIRSRDVHKILKVLVDYPFLLEKQSTEHLRIYIGEARKAQKKGSNRLNPVFEEFIQLGEGVIKIRSSTPEPTN